MIILGCITKYKPIDIQPYVESIEDSGYQGRKVMMVYDIPNDTIDYLKGKRMGVVWGNLNQHIILQRFIDCYKLLENMKGEVVIWTDVKDVIFQKDPTTWIEQNKKKPILSFSECITFKDDEWTCTNSGTSFPMEWEWLQHLPSYCCRNYRRRFRISERFVYKHLQMEFNNIKSRSIIRPSSIQCINQSNSI